MLSKTLRKHLTEKDWDYAVKRESNLSQTRSRLRKNIDRALNDLVLIAQKLPETELNEILATKNLEPFIETLLQDAHSPNIIPLGSPDRLDRRKARLCAMMIDKCVNFCILHIHFFMRETPSFKDPIISRLRQCIEICNDLANKIELAEIRNIGKHVNSFYLFNWSNVPGKDEGKVDLFIQRDLDLVPIGLKSLRKSRDNNSLVCKLQLEDIQDDRSVEFKIDNDTGIAILFNKNHQELKRVDLLVKRENKEIYIFMKN